jgi:hypothetical protein
VLVLEWSGIGVADLGDEPDAVIAAASEVLGPPTVDSGWGPDPIDDEAEFRYVQWGDGFFLWFGDVVSPYGAEGVRHFRAYEYYGSPAGLRTAEGIGVGDTVGDLLAVYGDETELVLNAITQEDYRYQVHPAGTDYYLCFDVGFEVPDESTLVASIWGGRTCIYGGE